MREFSLKKDDFQGHMSEDNSMLKNSQLLVRLLKKPSKGLLLGALYSCTNLVMEGLLVGGR